MNAQELELEEKKLAIEERKVDLENRRLQNLKLTREADKFQDVVYCHNLRQVAACLCGLAQAWDSVLTMLRLTSMPGNLSFRATWYK